MTTEFNIVNLKAEVSKAFELSALHTAFRDDLDHSLFAYLSGESGEQLTGFGVAEVLTETNDWLIFKTTCTAFGRANTACLAAFWFGPASNEGPDCWWLFDFGQSNALQHSAVDDLLTDFGWAGSRWALFTTQESESAFAECAKQVGAGNAFAAFFSDYANWPPRSGVSFHGVISFESKNPLSQIEQLLPKSFQSAKASIAYQAEAGALKASGTLCLQVAGSYDLSASPKIALDGFTLTLMLFAGSSLSGLGISLAGSLTLGKATLEIGGEVTLGRTADIALFGKLHADTSLNDLLDSQEAGVIDAVVAAAPFQLPAFSGAAHVSLDSRNGISGYGFSATFSQFDHLVELPPALGFKPTLATLLVQRAYKDAPVQLQIHTEARILESFSIFADIQYPEKQLRAGLVEGDKINIGTVADRLGLSPSSEAQTILKQFDVVDLEFGADLAEQEFDFAFEVQSTWQAAGHFTLDDIRLYLNYQAVTATRPTSAFGFLAEATFSINDLAFYASLDFEKEKDENGAETSLRLYAATGPGAAIAIGDLITKLATHLGAGSQTVPAVVNSMVINHISAEIEISTGDKNFEFKCTGQLDVAGQNVSVQVVVAVRQQEGAWSFTFTGILSVMGRDFGFDLEKNRAGLFLLASYYHAEGDKVWLHNLLEPLSAEIADNLPIKPEIILTQAIIALHKDDQSKYAFLAGLFMNVPMDFAGFPLIGSMLPADIGFKDLQLLLASGDFEAEAVAEFNKHLNLPISVGSSDPAVERGLAISGNLVLSDSLKLPISLHLGGQRKSATGRLAEPSGASSATAETSAAPVIAQPSANSQQKVGKTIGPLNLKKVALIFENGRIGLKITGGLALAAFEFELMGMQVTVPQSVLGDPAKISEIAFALDGFGVEIRKGTLAILGAFLHQKYPEHTNEDGEVIPAYDEYSGIVQVAFPPLNLTGMGAYAMYQGHPSLFLFVALGYPIPVHPSLLIEGMALGFGIHRDFIPPKPDEILTYPLIAVAVTPPPPIDIQQMAAAMHRYFPPAADLYFVVAGVKFKAFGLVDSLVMLAVKFGRSLEIDLIGVSSIFYPAAFIELAWTARFVPESGYLFIGGQLTERSYLLVPEVHITGGFAVAAWLAGEHEGDFVVSVGGYHPNFHVPDHYPNHIPRLGIAFHLGPADIKGGMYFAITPQCVMMGGALEVNVKQGSLSAFIKLSLDAIIFFEPFHYDVLLSADAGVKVDLPLVLTTLHIDTHLHIDMHIWGPEFSGVASLDVGPKTFDVAIGAAAEVKALPLPYETFKAKFLPTVCTVSVTQGLLRKAQEGGVEIYVVDAEKVVIEARSAIPITNGDDARLGITPMDVRGAGFHSQHTLRGDDKYKPAEIRDAVPAGLWGGAGLQAPDLTDPASGLVRDVLTGYRLTPAAERVTSETHAIEKDKLSYNTDAFTLKDREVGFQMVGHEEVAVHDAPTETYFQFTGLHASDVSQVAGRDLRQPRLLTYALN